MAEQAELLEASQLSTDRRRTPGHVGLLGQPLRSHRLPKGDVRLDDLLQKESLALVDLHSGRVSQGLSLERVEDLADGRLRPRFVAIAVDPVPVSPTRPGRRDE